MRLHDRVRAGSGAYAKPLASNKVLIASSGALHGVMNKLLLVVVVSIVALIIAYTLSEEREVTHPSLTFAYYKNLKHNNMSADNVDKNSKRYKALIIGATGGTGKV